MLYDEAKIAELTKVTMRTSNVHVAYHNNEIYIHCKYDYFAEGIYARSDELLQSMGEYSGLKIYDRCTLGNYTKFTKNIIRFDLLHTNFNPVEDESIMCGFLVHMLIFGSKFVNNISLVDKETLFNLKVYDEND